MPVGAGGVQAGPGVERAGPVEDGRLLAHGHPAPGRELRADRPLGMLGVAGQAPGTAVRDAGAAELVR